MNLIKKNKFQKLDLSLSNIRKDNFKIFLFTHINIYSASMIEFFSKEKKLFFFSLKLNLLKKITKNPLLLNLLCGPTYIFAFKCLNEFLKFVTHLTQNKDIIPLTILFKNNYYQYNKYVDYILNFKQKNNVKLEEIEIHSLLITKLTILNLGIINTLNAVYLNLLLTINYIINKKIC